ncbi:hypothetical protein [Streptomyces microflavus]|uniref:hypothetical protein n=1 Tax=Streptomyces microflavus TaxID=1919 RepID=UPI002E331E81|nr:hypothetical protein [Streptomyces microflavus]
MPRNQPSLDAFAVELAARLPGDWTSEYHHHNSYSDQFPVAERLWDAGHVNWAVSEYVLGHDAVLTGPAGQELYIVERPHHRGQFLVAALAPPGFKPHHFKGVPEPNGIVVLGEPARAAVAITHRLLPRYARAVEAVRDQARLQPDPPAHRQAPPEAAKIVTLTRYSDGMIGTPYANVPVEDRDAMYLSGFQYVPDQGAFLLPAGYGPVTTAVRIQVLAARLAPAGIGLNLRHLAAPPGNAGVTAGRAPTPQASRITTSAPLSPMAASFPRSPSRPR